MLRPLICSALSLALVSFTSLAPCGTAQAGTFNWANVTGPWSTPENWTPAGPPTGTDPTDILVFGGDVGSIAGSAPNYTSTNDISVTPFVLNGITLQATDINNQPTDPPIIIAGKPLQFAGAAPTLLQNGAGPITFNTKIGFSSGLTFTGNGTGAVTLNRGLSGSGNITKSGTSTFRFGTFPISPAPTAPSENTWMGNLVIDGGTIRFNNNADSGRTALRANGVIMSAGSVLSCTSQLRAGVLSGPGGTVESQVATNNTDNEDVVLTALDNGIFSGTIRLGPPTGTGNDTGTLIVRGPGMQVFDGTLNIEKDVAVGGSLVFAGNASMVLTGFEAKGAIVMQGGNFRLDNVTTNKNNRLRDLTSSSTGLEPIGGGVFTLDGNAGGTSETIGRLQLSSLAGSNPTTRPRSGHLVFDLVHRGGATALTLQSYNRDATTAPPLNTVEFAARDGSGTVLDLGQLGNTPRVLFNTLPPLTNSLFSTTSTTNGTETGWAVVRTPTGLAFASYGANGVEPVATTTDWTSNPASHIENGTSQTISGSFSAASLRLVPSSPGQQVIIGTSSVLNTTGIILTGGNDFEIGGAGTLTGNGPRYIHVDAGTLRLSAGVSSGSFRSIAKSGAGTLVLANTGITTNAQPIAINQGIVRVQLSPSTVPGGEIQLRGGVLELQGGGTFTRALVIGSQVAGPNTVNWSGSELSSGTPPQPSNLTEDRGSGGFAAIGGNATVDLGTNGSGLIRWEDRSFIQSGYALILGSPSADSTITLIDNFNLTSAEVIINYNAREIRVLDNPASPSDKAVLSGVIGGTIHNDLLKTGPGRLELSGSCTFAGAAIIQAGTLAVNGSIAQSIVADVRSGATLTGGGTVSAIILEDGGTLAPGATGIGTLNGTSLTWRGNGIARFELGADATADKLNLATGALLKGSAAGAFTFDFAGSGSLGQSYTLITFGSTDFAATDFIASNLAPGVTGSFQITAGSLVFVTDAPPAPEVVTGNATNITGSTATLDGTVNPHGGTTTAQFEYGTTTAYGSLVDVTPAPGSGINPVPVSANLSNLQPNTVYHYRLIASSAGGQVQGNDATFTTGGVAPTVVTAAATNVTDVAAILNGTVNPNALATTAYFEYGLTAAPYTQTAPVPDPGSGSSAVPVAANINGLLPSTTYHFRLVAQNSAGMVFGDDMTFVTSPMSSVPQPASDSLFVTGKAVTINVLSNDVNPASGDSSGLTLDGITVQPHFGSVTAATGQGTVTYTPAKHFPDTGDTFTYRVKNADGQTAEAQVEVRSFSSVKGSFAATIEEEGVGVSDTGSLSVTISATGKGSAKLIWERRSYAMKGSVGADGVATFVTQKITGGTLTLAFALNADGTAPGTIMDASTTETFAFTLTRAAADLEGSKIGPGVYTAWLPGDATLPGTGYVVATVDKKRNARFAGKLSDGQAFTDASKLLAHHYVLDPLLYKSGKTFSGQLRSEIQVTNGQTLGSEAEWFKAPVAGDAIYPGGAASTRVLEGEKFTASGASGYDAIIAALGSANVKLVFEGGNLPTTQVVALTLTSKKVTVGASTLPKLSVKLNAKQGLFSGTFTHPVSGAKTAFAGAFRKSQNEGRGQFPGVSIPGDVRITTTP